MSEPMYLQGDTIANSHPHLVIKDLECNRCQVEQEVEVQEEYAHGETTWYAEWTCAECSEYQSMEGWY